jgi:hypothetical protein
MCFYAWFILFFEIGFTYVALAGLELLGLSDPPASAIRVVGRMDTTVPGRHGVFNDKKFFLAGAENV